MSAREERRLALQTTAELWRGLDVLDMAIRKCQFADARDTIRQMRAVVQLADATLVDHLRNTPLEDKAESDPGHPECR